MSDIVTLNGYKIKDEKAVRSYETVALMKADTKLKEGYHVKTKGYYEANDGGGIDYYIDNTVIENAYKEDLQNGLYAYLLIPDTKVKLEWFGGLGNDEFINDNAFIQAVNSGKDIDFISGKTYKFSGELIDLASRGKRISFNGNNCIIKNLSFRYNITSNNKRAVASAIQSFNIKFKDITFQGNDTPILITTGNIDVEKCNFYDCDYCFGLPEFYVDYFHASDCYCSNTATFISPFGYDGTATDKGMYGDWITFDRCSFDWYQLVYASSPGHSSTVTINNCLHGTFTLNLTSSVTRSYFIFNNCHNESHDDRPKFITINGDYIPSHRSIICNNCYFYSEALPEDLTYIEMHNCTINYGNQGNYQLCTNERGSFERNNIYGLVWYDEMDFRTNKATSPTANGQYSTVLMSSNTQDLKTYETSHNVKYCMATSLEKDRLFFDGLSETINWTSDTTTEAGKCPIFNANGITRSKIKNVYLHIFKVMDGTTYRCVIPVTNIIRPVDTTSSIPEAIYFADEPLGVWGCAWEEYTGTVEYELS